MTASNIKTIVTEILATVLGKTSGEMKSLMDADFVKDLGMSSLQLFPLLSELEEQCNVDLDYATFLTDVHTPNEAVKYVEKLL